MPRPKPARRRRKPKMRSVTLWAVFNRRTGQFVALDTVLGYRNRAHADAIAGLTMFNGAFVVRRLCTIRERP